MSAQNTSLEPSRPLTRLTQIIYGSGDWGRASINTLRQIFYAIFLTDVVRLDPRLASVAALISILWDAINDPLVGSISDNVRTRWGRRRPFLLLFAVPFALAFVLLWWAPPWKSQVMLMIHVTLAFMVSDTIQTLITVPYLALTPEIAGQYDERTSLTGYRMFFNLVASLLTAVMAPMIVHSVINAGHTAQQGYVTVGAIFGGIAVIPYLLIFFTVREKEIIDPPHKDTLTFRETLNTLWQNAPFRFATGIYVLNWIAFDVVALMLPYFLIYWINGGKLVSTISIFGESIAAESVVLGLLLITATIALPFWTWLAKRTSKQISYISGMIFWVLVQLSIFAIQPGQVTTILIIAVLAGLSVSTAHVMPESIFPDVIDWDEMRTHARREGMYYGAVNFTRKLSSAIAIFLALQIIGWCGYTAPAAGALIHTQSANSLLAIRILTGPLIALLLSGAILFTCFYPLTRERQMRIRAVLERRRIRRQTLRENKTIGEISSTPRPN